jgi:hypothetical protein
MQLIYDSPYYTVLEFREGDEDAPSGGSYEIVDKSLRREIYLRGAGADAFRASVRELVAREPEQDEVDEFLSAYRPLMHQPVAVH